MLFLDLLKGQSDTLDLLVLDTILKRYAVSYADAGMGHDLLVRGSLYL